MPAGAVRECLECGKFFTQTGREKCCSAECYAERGRAARRAFMRRQRAAENETPKEKMTVMRARKARGILPAKRAGAAAEARPPTRPIGWEKVWE